jgi:hypothetical protein
MAAVTGQCAVDLWVQQQQQRPCYATATVLGLMIRPLMSNQEPSTPVADLLKGTACWHGRKDVCLLLMCARICLG